jgi:hypothetical protein
MGLHVVVLSKHRTRTIPEKVDRNNDGWRECREWDCGFRGRRKRRSKKHQILSIVSALNANIVTLPEEPKIGIAAVPRMRPRDNLFGPWSLPANQSIGKK